MERKKHSVMKTVIFMTLITALNLLGISYGQWQDGISNEIQISTGFIHPDFSGKVEVKKSGDFNELKASSKTDKNTGSKYVKLTGEIDSDKEGRLTLNYTVINKGTLPIKLDGEAFGELNKDLLRRNANELIILKGKPSDKVIYPMNYKASGKGTKGSLTLQVDASQEVGDYEFEIKVPYKQWNGN